MKNAHFEKRDRYNYIKVIMRSALPKKAEDDGDLW